jgi:hypothetical protein
MKKSLQTILIAVLALIGVSFVGAQSTQPPEGFDVPTPIHIDTTDPPQEKEGILNLLNGMNVTGTGVTAESLVVTDELSDGPNKFVGKLHAEGGLIIEKHFGGFATAPQVGRLWLEGSYVNDGDPTTIANCVELQQTVFESNKTYTLTNNIDCSATNPLHRDYVGSIWENDTNHYGFRPLKLGAQYNNLSEFVFDGRGFEIQNMHIEPKEGVGAIGGLFDQINTDNDSRIIDLSLVGFDIIGVTAGGGLVGVTTPGHQGVDLDNIYLQGSIDGTGLIGGLFGRSSGGDPFQSIFSNITTDVQIDARGSNVGGIVGSITNARIEDSYSYGDVVNAAAGTAVGGLAGYADAVIENSVAFGNVTSQGLYTGGLVGSFRQSDINYSAAYGDVSGSNTAGGLVGFLDVEGGVRNSMSYGDVTGAYDIAGLVGKVNSASVFRSFSTGSVSNVVRTNGFVGGSITCVESYWDTDTSGQGLSDCFAEGKTTTQMLDINTYQNWDLTEGTGVWKQVSADHYLCLAWMDDSMCVLGR